MVSLKAYICTLIPGTWEYYLIYGKEGGIILYGKRWDYVKDLVIEFILDCSVGTKYNHIYPYMTDT